jgi:hypothetical protein
MAPVQGASLYGHKVSAGFPSPADDYVEDRLDLNQLLVHNKFATFFLRVKGDSMINAGIHDCRHPSRRPVHRRGYTPPFQQPHACSGQDQPQDGQGNNQTGQRRNRPRMDYENRQQEPAYTTRWDELPVVS